MDGLRVIAIDWSGDARAPERRIRVAEVVDGALADIRPGARPAPMADELIALAREGPLLVGLDFAFGFPAWFARDALHARSAADVWAAAERDGERWLADCAPPFWGRPGRRRPPADPRRPQLRATDDATTPRPKSIFQIGGAGAVGTGSIRGMPLLARLRRAGFSIWPFADAAPPAVLEIYPRLLTGPVVKSDPAARHAHLQRDGRVPPALFEAAAATDDAFDATVSALELARHAAAILRLRADPAATLEGAIWDPARNA